MSFFWCAARISCTLIKKKIYAYKNLIRIKLCVISNHVPFVKHQHFVLKKKKIFCLSALFIYDYIFFYWSMICIDESFFFQSIAWRMCWCISNESSLSKAKLNKQSSNINTAIDTRKKSRSCTNTRKWASVTQYIFFRRTYAIIKRNLNVIKCDSMTPNAIQPWWRKT